MERTEKLTLAYALLPTPLAILALAFVRGWSPLPRAALAGSVAAVTLAVIHSLAQKGRRLALAVIVGFVATAGGSLVCDLFIK